MKNRTAALIVAAGEGKRFGGAVNKQFIEIHGKPILYYTLQKFQACPLIDDIVLVLPGNTLAKQTEIVKSWFLDKVREIVAGGPERHHSVQNGLALLNSDVGWVAIHDGVRPLVTVELIEATIIAAQGNGASIPGVIPRDTIKEIADDRVNATLDRSRLIQVQTPQVFAKEIILRAYQKAFEDQIFNTDDAALVERIGIPVAVVEGDHRNIKVTTPDDLIILDAYLQKEDSN